MDPSYGTEGGWRPHRPSKVGPMIDHDDDQHSGDDELEPFNQDSAIKAHTGLWLNGRRKPLTWLQVIWASATTLLISTIAFSSQAFVILPYYRNTDTFTFPQLLSLLVPFNFGVFLIFYNYYLCVKTNPGHVPRGWEPDWSALDPSQIGGSTIELKTYAHKPRYCKTCNGYKPPRSHHCKTCAKCVLRMDHHCPWVANCVGYHNYGHFIRFLAMVDVTCTYHLVMISMRVLDRWNAYSYWREPSTKEMLFLVLNYALCIPVLLLVGIFSIYHFYCLCINQTTIESWEKDKVQTMIRRGKIRKIKYPYNVGTFSNIKSVLGKSPLWWCVPQSMSGDGLYYDVADGIDPGAQYRWPPKDPSKQKMGPPLFSSSSGPTNGFQLPESPFTYGRGFNPALLPSNSARRQAGQEMRHRPRVAYDDGAVDAGCLPPSLATPRGNESDSGSESTLSSDSDDELPIVKKSHIASTAAPDTSPYEAWHEDEDEEEEDLPPAVRVRRGSEGYEVRPTINRWQVDEPQSDPKPLLPSQAFTQYRTSLS